ncbi:MAG: hypothetical protein ACYCU7_19070 [Acidimicrobiales bacterium]
MNKKIISLLLGVFFIGIGAQISAMDTELSTMIKKYHNKEGVEVYSLFSESLTHEGNIAYLKSLYSVLNANKDLGEKNQVSWEKLETLYITLFNFIKPNEEKDKHKETKIKKYRIVPSKLEVGIGALSLLTIGYLGGWLMHSFFNTK